MKKFTHYRDAASKLEQMAAEESEAHLKQLLTKLAATYRDMATKRANKLGMQPTSPPFELDSRD